MTAADVLDPVTAAASAGSFDDLVATMRGCVACPDLAASRTQVVPGVRPAGADVLLVGEAPGAQEDLIGVPFVGRSGQLLDTLLDEVGLPRAHVAVGNVLRCRPPGNRTPRRAEVLRCRPWLARQIELVDPAVVVALGSTATQWFFGAGARISSLRGQDLAYDGRSVVVTYHPSAAIRFGPEGEPLAALRADLAAVARHVEQVRDR